MKLTVLAMNYSVNGNCFCTKPFDSMCGIGARIGF